MTTNQLILCAVFAYFTMGGVFAAAWAAMERGFTGKVDPRVALMFVAWPLFFILRIPGAVFLIPTLAVAGFLTWVVSLVLA